MMSLQTKLSDLYTELGILAPQGYAVGGRETWGKEGYEFKQAHHW